ncbi:MAG: LamG-like jellyroll fold domain-containing protein [Caldilineaceae bacterium]
MTSPSSHPPSSRRRLALFMGLALLVVSSLGAYWWPHITSAATRLAASDPVTAAWEKAKAAGSYHFTSDVLQETIPVATITNVGRTSRTDALHMEGQNDLRNQMLELTLWNQGGSVLNAASGVSLRSEKGKSFTRRGNEAWQETDNQMDAFAPQGDFLGYLAAIRNVSPGVAETRNGIHFTRYTFDLDGPAFANYMHEQLTAAMRAKGELPPGVQLDPPAYYRSMTGSGELWVGANGLPLRQILNLRFPEQNDERVEASMTVDFANYGVEQSTLLTLLRTGQWQGAWLVLPNRLPDLTGLWLGMAFSVAALLVIRYRRARTVQTAIVTAVIVSQIVGPVLSTVSQARFFDNYRAKAAAQEEKQAADQNQRELQTAIQSGPEFNPHQNRLASVTSGQSSVDSGQWESMLQSPISSLQAAPAAQVTDPGTDTDGDGLTDFTEVRIGTSEVISDTDDDGLPDNLEVNGFTMGGQTWYTNPDVTDSNNDGQSDIAEWGIDSSTGLPQAAPRDTDGDSLPDLFDPDNDNDGVPDRVDAAPFTKGAVTYSEANPLQLTIDNLTPEKPTFVEFQIRPQDPQNLWFAYNVLDWPQDSDGQVRDVDGKTYADVATTQGRTPDASDANGDMKLVPMLEIRIPTASANLPTQAELTPYNISVNDFTADGATKVAYVPLTIVTDPLTGERVAFSGQMRYKPTGSWAVPHSVRLAWVVQGLNDLPCDPTAADAAAQGCQSDGYIHNYPSVLHSYYDDWTLSGLGVREDNGASMGILYEDPNVDPDKKDEAPLWALTDALSEHFLKPRDANTDGVRDLKLSDFPVRFDRDNSPTAAQRFEIPDILQVVTNSYTTGDEAAVATAMTETVKILDTAFKSSVQADNEIKPLLLFAQESNVRAVGLDQILGSEGYATQNGATVNFNLAPTAASTIPVTVYANLKWQAYCGANGNNITWRPCTSDEYAGVIEERYANVPSLPDDTDPAAVPGRMMLALAYYFTLAAGSAAPVQEGSVVASSRYRLEGESETATRLRLAINSVTALPQIVLQSLIHLSVFTSLGGKTTFLGQVENAISRLGLTYYQAKKDNLKLGDFEGVPTKAQIKAVKLGISSKLPIRFARFAAAAPIGSAIMLLTTILSQTPEIPTPARAVLGTIGALVTAGVTIYLPAATASDLYQLKLEGAKPGTPKPTLSKILNADFTTKGNLRIAFIVGLTINVALIWGFFIYAAVASGYTAGSPELNKAAAEAVAATVVAVLLAALSATFIGTIIVGIISLLDLIFTLVCELGAADLRLQGNFYGGACFSITTTATKVLAYFLYNYEPMIDTSRNELMVAGAPDVTLADPSKGFVPGNTVTLALPVTTTVAHKDPDPSNGLYINAYLWLYSQDNLRSSTFKYSLSQSGPAPQAVDLNQMTSAWQNVTEDHKYVLTPMYRGIARTDPPPVGGFPLTQGINSPVPFDLTMSFAIPAYECWPMWIPLTFVVFPVCRTREFESSNTTSFTLVKYDVFPATLADFVALGGEGDGGQGQRWDARFTSLRDADGDGLRGVAFNGLDPDDTTWDADRDGLSDRFELEQRAAGAPYSPILRDTDGDGLTDRQEAEIGTDAAVADTDNDGLSDGAEVRHQVYDANGNLTNTWTGGWQVTLNTTPARTIWVSSDPFNADSDTDGINDQAEKELAANPDPALRLDDQGIPYHPNVANTPPLAVFTKSDALFGYVAPGQSFRYTSTVVANVPVVPGVLNVNAPTPVGGPRNPVTLPFDPLTFSSSQTVTLASNFTVGANAADQALPLTSTATTRLPDTGPAGWTIAPVNAEAPLAIVAPNVPRFTALSASQPDRQDTYWLSALTTQNSALFGTGDLLNYAIPAGTVSRLENDANGDNALMLVDSPSLATNANGDTLAVWSEVNRCNTVTFNSLKVVSAGSDHGTSGIEPFLSFEPANGSEEQIWYWTNGTGGGGDVTSGTQFGPNGGGFPLTRSFCAGSGTIRVYESDGPVSDPAQNTLVGVSGVGFDGGDYTLTFSNGDQSIEVNVTVPVIDRFRLAGKIIGADGTVKRTLTFPASPVPTTYRRVSQAPTVASDGSGFLVAYESYSEAVDVNTGATTLGLIQLATQGFDKDGNALNSSYRAAISSLVEAGLTVPNFTADIAWIGNGYRVVWQDRRISTILMADVPASGASIGAPDLVATAAANNIARDEAPKIAYDPITNRSIVVHLTAAREIRSIIYQGAQAVASDTVAGQWYAPQIVWNPVFQGWLLSYQSNADRTEHHYAALDSAGVDLLAPVTGFAVATSGNSLACPAFESVPVVDLRFEELPSSTTFTDHSGYGNDATCSGVSCPAAGFSGAPNAPLSDYAVHFDGVDDVLTLNRTVQDNFTIAFWLNTATANSTQMLVDGGTATATGFQIFLNNGALAVNVPGVSAQQTARIDDGAWHFVAVSRNKATGRVEAFVDGSRVINALGTAGVTLNGVSDLRIGKNRNNGEPLRGAIDHLQIWEAALAQATVQAIFNRTNQSYCVTTGVNAGNVHWGRVQASQPDVRGGRISASGGLLVKVDGTKPTASIMSVSNNDFIGVDQVIGGSASDVGVGVALVEVSVNNGPWQLASGTNTWSFSLAGLSGNVSLRVRATDAVGNVGDPSAAVNVTIDNTPPAVTITPQTSTLKPTKNASGQWQVPLSGTASDANGIKADSILVKLTQTSGVGLAQTSQVASGNWNIDYLLDPALFDPTGSYTVTVQADDNAGNRTVATPILVRLDATGPVAVLSATDLARQTITQTVTIGGVISDTGTIPGSNVGLDKAEIAFTPIEQIAALPGNITSTEAEALLNRTWTPVTLAQRGAGVAQTTWSFAIPTGLENIYQIDVRGYDLLGNVSISASLWRGMIDTRDPRVVMQATATGTTYFDAAANQQKNEIRFLCAVQDRNLDEGSFVCPGEGLAEPVRSFDNNPALQALFPDLTLRTGLAISYTLWTTSTPPAATASACDTFGRCAQASTGTEVSNQLSVNSRTVNRAAVFSLQAAAAPGAPTAVIVNPTNGSFVAAGNAISVTVAAEAGTGLKDVTIKLDNAVVQTLSFAQSPVITRTLRTVNVPIATEGQHTLVAQATAWDNSTQTTLFPVVFTLDQNAPTLTIDAGTLTLADTWQAQSGVLRFNGNASDSVALAAVQIREGANDFTDATFGNGTWRVALPVADPEGRTLNITVRAIDRAGRITQLNQNIATDLSAADAPDTGISSGPANPSNVNTAQFVFTGSATAAAFECSLDNGVYTPCASPTTYTDLSKGEHTFLARAIDGRGLPDLSPATFTWSINAGQPDATITGKPTEPTTERTATFTFVGGAGATSFECSLDGSDYSICTSPVTYNNLGNGEHTFLVRARNSANEAGAAERYLWTVTNVAPVANGQTVIVIPNQAKAITLSATDNEPLVYTIVTPPAHGVLSGIAPNLTYSPDTNYGGADRFTFKASDGLEESNVAIVTLFVDNVPPTVTCSANPNNVWPPNNKFVTINVAVTVTDDASGPAGFTLLSIANNETGAGDVQGWTVGTPDTQGEVRASRNGNGNGRIYTLTYEGRDVAGNAARCTTTVTVPKNQGGVVAATYDENQVLTDAYVDAQPAPADAVATPTVETPNNDLGVINPETLTIHLFLPVIVMDNGHE